MTRIENTLSAARQKSGLSAARVAALAGVSRQTIYAMEAGSYVPNTAVALRLARALDTSVEGLFSLPDERSGENLRKEQAALLPGSEQPQPGQPVQLCRVDRRLIASPPSAVRWYFPASDGVIADRTEVQVFDREAQFENRILVAGCDPGISVLARHAGTAGIELVLAHRNSSQSLELLKSGSIHIAGTHLRDDSSGESNIPAIGRLFSRNAVAVISFAVWEEGIVTAHGNPKAVREIADFAREDVTIVNREPGAGARNLLESHLKRLGIRTRTVRGFGRIAHGHLPAAWQVKSGLADCCVATRAAARLFGLGFIPLATERYDLAIRRPHLQRPAIQTLLDVLSRSNFRRELETLGGYDAQVAGQRLL